MTVVNSGSKGLMSEYRLRRWPGIHSAPGQLLFGRAHSLFSLGWERDTRTELQVNQGDNVRIITQQYMM